MRLRNAVFNGEDLYRHALQQMRDRHLCLASTDARAAWYAEWESKCANAAVFGSEEATDKAVALMVASLEQRFDVYMGVAAAEAEKKQIAASMIGIGVSAVLKNARSLIERLPDDVTEDGMREALVISDEHPLIVKGTQAGGPAHQAGVVPGDVIAAIAGDTVIGMPLYRAISKLTASAGTPVLLTVERTDSDSGARQRLELTVVPNSVPDKLVRVSDLGNGLTCVQLRNFMSQHAEDEMREALKQALEGRALIIDLRNNGGGRLEAVVAIAGMVLKEGTILSIRQRDGDVITLSSAALTPHFLCQASAQEGKPETVTWRTSPREPLVVPESMPVVVLVNQSSASAAEILAGALQQHRRALVVGSSTVGKGVGQAVIDLPCGRRMHITCFETMPAGQPLNWVGIIPDLAVAPKAADREDRQLQAAAKAIEKELVRRTRIARRREKARLSNAKNHRRMLRSVKKAS